MLVLLGREGASGSFSFSMFKVYKSNQVVFNSYCSFFTFSHPYSLKTKAFTGAGVESRVAMVFMLPW
jgi:hypothetical protein